MSQPILAPFSCRRGRLIISLFPLRENASSRFYPCWIEPLSAGFPSPAEDFLEEPLDLQQALIRHPAATFLARVEGDSMLHAGIHSQDLLVIDRSLEPREGHVVVAVLDGELTVKRLTRREGQVFLVSEHPEYAPIEVRPEMDFHVWGVVTFVIHSLMS